MARENLVQYYQEEYSGVNPSLEKIIRCDANPYDRFEASVYYLRKLIKGGHILELGAGRGVTARSLMEAGVPFERYTITDLNEEVYERFEGVFEDPRIEIRQMDADRLPEDAGPFDVILMVALIEHLVDPMDAMRKIRTMLRPGGFVYIDTPNIAKYTRRLKLLAGRFPSTASHNEGLTTHYGESVRLHDEGHLHYFTFRSLSLMLTEYCGFSRVEKLPYFTGKKLFGRKIDSALARWSPELFSELNVAAYV